MKKFIGSQEFINGNYRWCLWLKDASPSELRALPEVIKRMELVKETRLKSKRTTTQNLSKTPLYLEKSGNLNSDYIAFPEVPLKIENIIPVGFISKDIITSNKNYTVASCYHYIIFGVLSSTMHMAWVKSVCGRMKSDYSYSTGYCLQQLSMA